LFLLGPLILRGYAGTGVQFRTPVGDIEVELLDADKPQTVRNFIQHVEAGRYQDIFLHYLVPGFVAAGGGFRVVDRGSRQADFAPVDLLPPVPNETRIGTVVSNTVGTLSMGRLTDGVARPITGEWFFNLGTNTPALETVNGGYPVFGRVTAGLEVLKVLNQFVPSSQRTTQCLVILNDARLPFASGPKPVLPLMAIDFTSPLALYQNLVWVDVTLLHVRIADADGQRRIAWNAVPGRTNRVEYTDAFPPHWQVLSAFLPTGTNGVVSDVVVDRRFYRVRVDPPVVP
jgi:cyclophilin family peptidyl-prolyl cis-trans isomerase